MSPKWRICWIRTPKSHMPNGVSVACLDECPTQPIGELPQPILVAPGQPPRRDDQCCRNSTAKLLEVADAHRRWCEVKVSEQRTTVAVGECMRDPVDVHYPRAYVIYVVMDNLSTEGPGALYEAGASKLLEPLRLRHDGLRTESGVIVGWSPGARFYPMTCLLARTGKARDWGTDLPLRSNLLDKINRLAVHLSSPRRGPARARHGAPMSAD